MKRPSFLGWVSRELRYLFGSNTLSLRKLAALAQNEEPRLRERLVLYALASGQVQRLAPLLQQGELKGELQELAQTMSDCDFTALGDTVPTNLPPRYKKVFDSFYAAYHSLDTKRSSKELRRKKAVELQKSKGISCAAICQNLMLDPGNVSAYLHRGDLNRISLATATDIMKYLVSA